MVLKRYFLAYGALYVKVVVSSLILMIIGATLFQVGIYYIGENFVIPPDRFFQPLPPPYSKYILADMYPKITKLSSEEEILSFNTIFPGYLAVNIKSEQEALIKIRLVDLNKNNAVYIILTRTGETVVIPFNKPGKYALYMAPAGSQTTGVYLNIMVSIYYLRENPDAVIAKWLQGLGVLIYIIGLIVFFLSPVIASKYAETAYNLVPREIREELAELGIAQLHRKRLEESEQEDHT
jgi:hypothetical protein